MPLVCYSRSGSLVADYLEYFILGPALRALLRFFNSGIYQRQVHPIQAYKVFISRPHLKANLITWPGALKSFSEAFKSFSKSFKSFSEALKVGITLIRPLSSHP